jgi:small-conductance mechanosensitive channel
MRFVIHTAGWRQNLLLAFLLLTGVDAQANAAENKAAEALKPSASAAIPVEEVAAQATAVGTLIRAFSANYAPDNEIETIRKFLPQLSADLVLELNNTTNILNEQPALETLESQEQIWQQKQSQLTAWLNILTNRATKLQVALNQLKRLQETWTRTRAESAATAPPPILQQIDATLATIETAQKPHQALRDDVLDLQSKVAELVASSNSALAQIAAVQQRTVGGVFARENPPIWDLDLWSRARVNLRDRVTKIAASYWRDILLYGRDPSRHLLRHLAIFILLSLVLFAARRYVGQQEAREDRRPWQATAVFDHVFAGAFLVTLMVATAPASPTPINLKQLFEIVALVPIIVLTRRAVHPIIVPVVYALAILFAIDTLRRAITGEPPAGQGLLVLEAAAGIAVLVWLLVSGRRRAAQGLGQTSPLRRTVAAFIISFLAVGLIAAVFGYMRLARLTIPGVLAGGALALELYASVQVAMAVVVCAFRVWPLRHLYLVQHHTDLLERRTYRLLLWLAAGAWLSRYLDYLGLLDPVLSLIGNALNTRLERGAISLSVGDIVAFFLTLLAAYLLSVFVRFVLEEDVYSRARIASGQSYAVSSLLNYAILTVGFVVALGVLGMDLTRITVLAGAFGVGIGFGLQSVVNNFVSGLILLFERPFYIGDTIQMGGLQGRVRRIGIRASIVRTFQGAEIIVPNANLITQEVTNWTLSDQLRRIDLPVGVSYGTAPKKVIELLEGVARGHPEVLQDPAPRALFMGYGDSSINFELRAWAEFARWQQVHSDLTVAVYDAVYAAGMSFPFPQRDLHIVSEDLKSIAARAADGDNVESKSAVATKEESSQRSKDRQ